MTPKEYVRLNHYLDTMINFIRELRNAALTEAKKSPLPKRLKPAQAWDITRGAIIWYPDGDEGPFWCIVENVSAPNDPFKAFDDEITRSRYGLDGAFVEIYD
jgi:hypothetical protein